MSRTDRGAVSTFVAVVALALLVAAGLAIDGGRKVNALREASNLAGNAARAGAQAVDFDTFRTTGELRVDAALAEHEVRDYLSALGHTPSAVTVGGVTVGVTVAITIEPILLPIGPITVTATQTADAITEDP